MPKAKKARTEKTATPAPASEVVSMPESAKPEPVNAAPTKKNANGDASVNISSATTSTATPSAAAPASAAQAPKESLSIHTSSENSSARNTSKISARQNGSSESIQEAIRQRAYELYVERGSLPGHEHEDWLRAEHEVATQSRERQTA
jgi:hypothetical protein